MSDNQDNKPVSLFLYDPYEHGGANMEAFNWLNATHFGWIGWHDMGKSAAPGYQTRPFEAIPDEDIGGDIVKYGWSHLGDSLASNATDKKDCYFTDETNRNPLARLFEPYKWVGPDDSKDDIRHYRGYRYEMATFFNNANKWYQMMGYNIYNTTDYLYPFAVKGISFTMAVPPNHETFSISNNNNAKNYGDYMTLDRMDGLWRDKNGKYYMYKMYPWGDNRQHNDELQSKNHHYFDGEDGNEHSNEENLSEEWRNGYSFTDESQSKKDTSKWWKKNLPGMEESVRIHAYTTKDVSELFFCGFSWRTHISQNADMSRPHTHRLFNLTPIPYSFDRHGSARGRKAVLGYPTHIAELREGKRALRYRDPDYTPYAAYPGRLPKEFGRTNSDRGDYKKRCTGVPYQKNGVTDAAGDATEYPPVSDD